MWLVAPLVLSLQSELSLAEVLTVEFANDCVRQLEFILFPLRTFTFLEIYCNYSLPRSNPENVRVLETS